MIQHPFDYAVNYLLKLHEPQIGQLSDLDTTKGLVAHRFVELLVKKYGEQMAEEYDRIPQEQKSNLMVDAIQQKALFFCCQNINWSASSSSPFSTTAYPFWLTSFRDYN
jgi:hypothetical protein